jgi:hypothetical protein
VKEKDIKQTSKPEKHVPCSYRKHGKTWEEKKLAIRTQLSPSNSKQTKRKYNIRKHLSKKRKAKKRTHILRTFSLMRSFLAWGKALAVALALALAQLSISTNAKTSKRSNAATNLLSNRGDPMDCGFNSISLCREEKRRRGEERRGWEQSRDARERRDEARGEPSIESIDFVKWERNGFFFVLFW